MTLPENIRQHLRTILDAGEVSEFDLSVAVDELTHFAAGPPDWFCTREKLIGMYGELFGKVVARAFVGGHTTYSKPGATFDERLGDVFYGTAPNWLILCNWPKMTADEKARAGEFARAIVGRADSETEVLNGG